MNASNAASIDPAEVALFGGLSEDWWNPHGTSRMLHAINPARLGYIRDQALAHFGRDARARPPFAGLRALDIGCGGGLLCEPLARQGFSVTGLDAAAENITIAHDHAAGAGLTIDYRSGSAEALAANRPGQFDLITCLEVIEHVADIDSFLAAIAALLAPGGLLILSTPNRTALSYAVLIVGAERLARIIPQGAHDWNKFVTPDELATALARHGLTTGDRRGLSYRPGRGFAMSADLTINYFMTARGGA
jgi:2-polyprenyl-6-hydroxyphenyl methylase / 3-demethylubiquinone-9 3-methyltransferase